VRDWFKIYTFETWREDMRTFIQSICRFENDEDGAALIEYTVLLGLLTVGVVATIGLVGTWVSGQWTALNAAL
jgi:pilus assembly protein Flp/PilA